MAKQPQAAVKSEFLGVRLTKDERRKVLKLSLLTSEPGSLSAGVRAAISQARAPQGEQPEYEAEAVQYA